MSAQSAIVFLIDVDNTLLDNDQIITDLRDHLRRAFGISQVRDAATHRIPEAGGSATPQGTPA